MVGIDIFSLIILANFAGTHSKTIANAPAFSMAMADSINSFAASSSFPCTLNPPKALTDCGVRPICPITGIDAFTIASILSHTSKPPSNFTACALPSFISLPAFTTASYTDV